MSQKVIGKIVEVLHATRSPLWCYVEGPLQRRIIAGEEEILSKQLIPLWDFPEAPCRKEPGKPVAAQVVNEPRKYAFNGCLGPNTLSNPNSLSDFYRRSKLDVMIHLGQVYWPVQDQLRDSAKG